MVSPRYNRIYGMVRRIPRGRVATYGQVAELAGFPGQARQVGYALRALADDENVPWHRVINARGELSPRAESTSVHVQRALLRAEGIRFDAEQRVSLVKYGWKPR